MTTIQKISLLCPICDAAVLTNDIVSTNCFGGKRTDFHERAAGTQPYPYLIHTCVTCGFTGTKYDFGDESEFKQVDKFFFRSVLSELTQGLNLTGLLGSEKYELAAKIAERQGLAKRTISERYLRAAWCCMDEGDTEAERFFRVKSAKVLSEFLSQTWISPDEWQTTPESVFYYLVGELYRRTGFVKLAHEWFDKVSSHINDLEKERWVIDAANQQKYTPREWFG